MAHIATMQYFINIAEEQCGADWLAAVARFCHLWVIGWDRQPIDGHLEDG